MNVLGHDDIRPDGKIESFSSLLHGLDEPPSCPVPIQQRKSAETGESQFVSVTGLIVTVNSLAVGGHGLWPRRVSESTECCSSLEPACGSRILAQATPGLLTHARWQTPRKPLRTRHAFAAPVDRHDSRHLEQGRESRALT